MANGGTTRGLKYQSRAIAPQLANASKTQWLAGTNALREQNEIQLLELDGDSDTLHLVGSFHHAPEVWSITPSPIAAEAFITVYNQGGTYGASLWYMPSTSGTLEEKASLAGHNGVIRGVWWHPRDTQMLASVEDSHLRTWTLSEGSIQSTGEAEASELHSLSTGAWDSKDAARFVTAAEGNIQVWDLRTLKQASEVSGAHNGTIRDLDFAHQREHLLASAGDDCRVRYWDIRHTRRRLLEVSGHAHWVWQARFNPFHDQLLASCSSDGVVNLLHAPSLSGGGVSMQGSPAAQRGIKDGCAQSFDVHEDSVYGVAWSAVDPWVFASVSYDGRVAVNRVPSGIKYKILL